MAEPEALAAADEATGSQLLRTLFSRGGRINDARTPREA